MTASGLSRTRKNRSGASCPSEDAEQLLVVFWLDRKGLLYHASPNGGVRNVITAARLKRLGCKRGFPDIMVFDSTMHGHKGLAIEMKRVKGSHTEPDQLRWQRDLTERNWRAVVCHGAAEAIEVLTQEYGK